MRTHGIHGKGEGSFGDLQADFRRRETGTVGTRWPVNGQYAVAFPGAQFITKKSTAADEVERFKVMLVTRTRKQGVRVEIRIDLREPFGSDRISERIKNKECEDLSVVRALDGQS